MSKFSTNNLNLEGVILFIIIREYYNLSCIVISIKIPVPYSLKIIIFTLRWIQVVGEIRKILVIWKWIKLISLPIINHKNFDQGLYIN